ncbi:MAG: endonuclease [Clostridia bacterium]|nr:endonuclease [Clostridia bacterium]
MKQMKRSLALLLVLLVLLQAFAVCIGAAVSTPSFKNTGRRHVAATALSASAVSYYANYSYTTLAAQSASTLLNTLRTLMTSTHTSTSTYENCRDLAMYTDTDNTGKISLLYTSYNTDYENGYINKVSNGWNREHVWPQSIGGFATSGAGADLHHIRPSDSLINSKRGNDKYGEVNGGTAVSGTGPSNGVLGGYSSGSYFEPLDNVKGDVARICLYIYVRYGSELSGCSSVTNAFQSVEVLLDWCASDPVDEWEMGRNDVVASVQGNRNVFIDYPEYAWLIFGEEVPENLATPTGSSGITPPPSSGGSGSTTPSTPPSTPTTPVYNKVTSLKTGDEIIITAPAYNKALSMQKVATHYNKGVNYTETDFSGITNDEIFVVTANADDTYTFTSKSGKVLAMSTEYNSLNDAGTNKTWSLEQKSGTTDVFYLKNVGRGTYLEWYDSKDNWSTYNPNSLSNLFELSFYLVPPPHEHQFVNGSCECGATDPNYVPPGNSGGTDTPSNPGGTVTPPATGSDKVANFEFGDNGSGQTDGTKLTADKSYTDGSYTLTLTGPTNVYGGARDEAGGSCLKMGTSSNAGSFNFTVGADIAKVVIRAGAYKEYADNNKLIVNGTTYTLPSGNGEYMEIEINTGTNKTVTVATTGSKPRAEIDSIAFYLATTSHEHQFVNGSCSCGATDPNYVPPSTPSNPSTPGGNTNTDVNQGGSNAPTTGGDQGTSTLPQEKDNTVLIIIVIVVCVLVLGASAVAFVIVYKKTKSKVE